MVSGMPQTRLGGVRDSGGYWCVCVCVCGDRRLLELQTATRHTAVASSKDSIYFVALIYDISDVICAAA